jgi:hypothetical protein
MALAVAGPVGEALFSMGHAIVRSMGRKPNPKPDDPEQSKRFIETAEEVGADTDDEALERAFKKIVPVPKRRPAEKQ